MASGAANDVGGYRAQALTRGLEVLRTLGDHHEPMTLQELFDSTTIPKPTLVRLLAILTHEGCTVRLDDRPTYALGPTIAAIASGMTADQRPEDLARPYLEELAGAAGNTANLGILSGRHVLHVCVVLADRPVRYDAHAGTRDDLHSTGLGKALLAQLPAARVNALLGSGPLQGKTGHTIVARSKLDAELRTIRKQGFSHDAEESALGLCCFAVPIFVRERPVAAVSVSGPAAELPATAARSIIPKIKATAEQIAEDPRLGPLLYALTSG